MLVRIFASLLLAYGMGILAVLLLFPKASWWNLNVGFFGALFIMCATFAGYYRHVLEACRREELVILEEQKRAMREDSSEIFDEEEEAIPALKEDEPFTRETLRRFRPKGSFSARNLWLGMRLSLSLLRLLAYALFIAGVFYLIRHEILHAFALMIGIFCASAGIVGVILLRRAKSVV